MLISRWQANTSPHLEQLKLILQAEGLDPKVETFVKNQKMVEKRHPFGEVRYVVEGELFLNVAGTQLLLRAGDRIEIPANTKHSYSTQNDITLSIYSLQPY